MKKISVTALAKLGKCERQAYLDYFYGDDHCAVRAAAQRGSSAHEEFARRIAGQDRRTGSPLFYCQCAIRRCCLADRSAATLA